MWLRVSSYAIVLCLRQRAKQKSRERELLQGAIENKCRSIEDRKKQQNTKRDGKSGCDWALKDREND